jgi:UDP-N-acetylmuramoyl-L-alanyl-D-glutamate--2,6-diaminopimelate ligase
MQFRELLASAGIGASLCRGDVDITAVMTDSRRCSGGSCFIAVRGAKDDGHQFIPQAIAKGCSAVVCEDASLVPENFPLAVVANSRLAVAKLAQAMAGWPARKLTCIGVTGTNGKSTTTCIIRDILVACGHSTALLGTITYETGGRSIAANQTTPDPLALAEMTAEMAGLGKTHLVMETSSHALHQDRTAGLEFKVGVFTNLTGDHLDYHKTMEDYLQAKCRLFEQLPPDGYAVINQDDPVGTRLAQATKARVIMFGLSPAADLRAKIDTIDAHGTKFEMIFDPKSAGNSGNASDPGIAVQKAMVHTPLIGRHNVYNCLSAAGACLALGISLQRIAEVLSTVRIVPGRLEPVHVEAAYRVFVDYAHTDDALLNVLGALRPVTQGKLILVFGCGGDRDHTKRPRMAGVAEKLADSIIVTSDNPRSENPQTILDDIQAGFTSDGLAKVQFEVDRSKAIAAAIGQARKGDIVLIAGKGHEKYQVVGSQRNHFDDVEQASEAMHRREGLQ